MCRFKRNSQHMRGTSFRFQSLLKSKVMSVLSRQNGRNYITIPILWKNDLPNFSLLWLERKKKLFAQTNPDLWIKPLTMANLLNYNTCLSSGLLYIQLKQSTKVKFFYLPRGTPSCRPSPLPLPWRFPVEVLIMYYNLFTYW